jgi:hypothetical protein
VRSEKTSSCGLEQLGKPEKGERQPLKSRYKATASEDSEDFMCALVTVIFAVTQRDSRTCL